MARKLILLAVAIVAVAVWASKLSFDELLRADTKWVVLSILSGALPVPLLALRWRAWEEQKLTVGEAYHWTGASVLAALALGPIAGDVLRGVGGERGWRGIITDRVGNTAAAFGLAAATYEPTGAGLLAVTVALAFAVRRFGWVVAQTTVLTLAVFAVIGLQLGCAARAVGMNLSLAELAFGLPAVLVSSLIPVAFLGVTGRELSVPLIFSGTGAFSASAILGATTFIGTGLCWLSGLGWAREDIGEGSTA